MSIHTKTTKLLSGKNKVINPFPKANKFYGKNKIKIHLENIYLLLSDMIFHSKIGKKNFYEITRKSKHVDDGMGCKHAPCSLVQMHELDLLEEVFG